MGPSGRRAAGTGRRCSGHSSVCWWCWWPWPSLRSAPLPSSATWRVGRRVIQPGCQREPVARRFAGCCAIDLPLRLRAATSPVHRVAGRSADLVRQPADPQPAADVRAPGQEGPGYVTFGTKTNKHLRVTHPRASFSSDDPRIVWSAYLSSPADAADLHIRIFKVDPSATNGKRLLWDHQLTIHAKGAEIYKSHLRTHTALTDRACTRCSICAVTSSSRMGSSSSLDEAARSGTVAILSVGGRDFMHDPAKASVALRLVAVLGSLCLLLAGCEATTSSPPPSPSLVFLSFSPLPTETTPAAVPRSQPPRSPAAGHPAGTSGSVQCSTAPSRRNSSSSMSNGRSATARRRTPRAWRATWPTAPLRRPPRSRPCPNGSRPARPSPRSAT